MPEIVTFQCGSSGHPDYCPGQCQFGKFCKLVKEQAAKPRGMPVPKPEGKDKRPEKVPPVEEYY